MTQEFTSLSKYFSYIIYGLEGGNDIMKSIMHWNPVYGPEDFTLSRA